MVNQSIRKSTAAAAVLACLIFLSSCATFVSRIRAQMEGVPAWTIQTPQATLQQLFFTGEGTDVRGREEEAFALAVDDLLDEISAYLSYSVNDAYRRELVMTKAVQELGLTIIDDFIEASGETGIRVHLLVGSDRRILSRMVRSSLESTRASAQLIEQPIRQAETAYSRREDFTALRHYFTAAAEAARSPLESAPGQYRLVMERIAAILSDFVLRETASNPAAGTVTLQMTRGEGMFAPKLAGALFRVEYPVKTSTGMTRVTETSLTTDSGGRLSFSTANPDFRGQGEVRFYLDLRQEIRTLEGIVGSSEPLLQNVKRAAAEIRYSFPFALISRTAGTKLAAALLEFDMNGLFAGSDAALESFSRIAGRDGFEILPVRISADAGGVDNETVEGIVIAEIRERYGTELKVAIFGNAGITALVPSGSGYVATAQGLVKAVDVGSGNTIGDSGRLVANGIGSGRNEAMRASFARFGELAASNIIPRLL